MILPGFFPDFGTFSQIFSKMQARPVFSKKAKFRFILVIIE